MPRTKRKRPAAATIDQNHRHAARRYGVTLRMDPAHERVKVRELAREMLGTYPSPPTVWRWLRGKGATGLALPGVLLDNTWYTTRECWQQWLELRTRAKLGLPLDVSDAELAEAGLAD